MARPLYIHSLRLREAEIASRAALALMEIGDPQGESVPYLIDSLVGISRMKHMVSPDANRVVDFMTYYTTPGYNPNALGEIWWVRRPGRARCPFTSGRPACAGPDQRRRRQSETGDPRIVEVGPPAAIRADQSRPGYLLHHAGRRRHVCRARFGRSQDKYSRAPVMTENPTVLDALVKITDRQHPGYGYNADNWRRFWATEKENREGVKPPSEDRVLPRDQAAQH